MNIDNLKNKGDDKSHLILYKQGYKDTKYDNYQTQLSKTQLLKRKKLEFLTTMTKIFHSLRWLGIAGGESIAWKIWGMVILIIFVAIEIEAIWKIIKALAGWAITLLGSRSVTARFAGTMFYTGSMLGLILCWRLSSSWQGLSKYWASLEMAVSIKYIPLDKTISKRMYTVVSVFLFCSVMEHVMSIVVSSDLECPVEMCLRLYILQSHGFLILEHEYRDWIAVLVLFMSNLATFLWNLQDLIIILISMGLTSRYKRLNQCVATVSEMNQRNKYWCKNIETLKVYTWRKIREEYVKQAKLVRKVDGQLGILILASAFFNFYFICLQLFLGITRGLSEALIQQMYFFISFSWLCIRTVSAVLAAADVNRLSNMALPYLYQCQPQFYNIEIQRLQKQLTQDYVALSGMGFYQLNRTYILQMAAAVLTYVLVLIQYDDSGQTPIEQNAANTTH